MNWKEKGYEALEWSGGSIWSIGKDFVPIMHKPFFVYLTTDGAFLFGTEEHLWLKEDWRNSTVEEEGTHCICLFWTTEDETEERNQRFKKRLGEENYEQIKKDLENFIKHYND